jgi:hypothetical protein
MSNIHVLIKILINKISFYKKLKNTPDHKLKEYALFEKYPFYMSTIDEIIIGKKQFDLKAKNLIIRHFTSENRAKSIISSKMIFGRDGNQAAHFELYNTNHGGAIETKVTMYYEWIGPQKCVSAKHKEGIANILFHVSPLDHVKVSDTGDRRWESRIYPGTQRGLYLVGVYCSNGNSFIRFEKPLEISVVPEKEFYANGYSCYDD